jgi:predicted phage tail protein
MSHDIPNDWKKAVAAEMEEDLERSPRAQRELIPYFINIIDGSDTIAEAIFRVNDAYLPTESMMYFAYFSGKIVERNQWHHKMDQELEKAEQEIRLEVREELQRDIEDSNKELAGLKKDLLFIKQRQDKIIRKMKKHGLKMEDFL